MRGYRPQEAKEQTLGKGHNMMFKVATLLYSKCPLFHKKLQCTQRNREEGPIQRTKINCERLTLKNLHKELKSTVVNKLKELKEITDQE